MMENSSAWNATLAKLSHSIPTQCNTFSNTALRQSSFPKYSGGIIKIDLALQMPDVRILFDGMLPERSVLSCVVLPCPQRTFGQ
tara:strand:- start:1 stop:252 length:252 start_codon:yes stop_codon:yes gene_type:complete